MTAAADRCIVATGTANGVQRRLMVRVTTQGGTGTQPLSDGTVKAVDSVKIESGVTFTGSTSGNALQVNSKLEVSNNSTITGTVRVGRKAKVKGISSYTRDANNDVIVAPPPPDFGTTATAYNATTKSAGTTTRTSPAPTTPTPQRPRAR